MAIHTDTKTLQKYQPQGYPNIAGGEQRFFTQQLADIAKSVNQLVEVMKLLEARMNTNGLT